MILKTGGKCGRRVVRRGKHLQIICKKLVTPGFRAEALYDYRALAFGDDDREEVSFSKLDTFDVLDNSGKWWTVRKDNNGRIGIAPSKFLQVIT
jgi:hypothetical protein